MFVQWWWGGRGGGWGGTGGLRVKRGVKNNSLLSAGVLGKEQVRRYPLHRYYSFYLTPLMGGGEGAESRPSKSTEGRHVIKAEMREVKHPSLQHLSGRPAGVKGRRDVGGY